MDIDAAVIKGMRLAFVERQRASDALKAAHEAGADKDTIVTLNLDWELGCGKVSGYRSALRDLLGSKQAREIEDVAKAALGG